MYALLSPAKHIFLTIVWAVFAAIFFFVFEPPVPFTIALVGTVLGTIGGVMMHLSFNQAADRFAAASSVLDVRRTFKSTSWGCRYILWQTFSNIILVVIAFLYIRQPLLSVLWGYIAGLMPLGFMRELVTLRDSFSRKRLSSDRRIEAGPNCI